MNACTLLNNNYLNIVTFNLYTLSCFLLYVCIVFTPVPSDSHLAVVLLRAPQKTRPTSRFYSPYHVHYPLHHLSDDILWPLYDEMKLQNSCPLRTPYKEAHCTYTTVKMQVFGCDHTVEKYSCKARVQLFSKQNILAKHLFHQ
jgi:hypothetical protein